MKFKVWSLFQTSGNGKPPPLSFETKKKRKKRKETKFMTFLKRGDNGMTERYIVVPDEFSF